MPIRPHLVRHARAALVSLALVLALVSLAACAAEPPCPAADLAPLPREPGFAVVLTDYVSTAIAILDPEGEPITEAWIDSGTSATGIRAGLAGDVLAVGSDPRGRIALLERFSYDVLTLIPHDGADVAQLDVRGDEEQSGFSPNAQDAVFLGASAWVARLNPALDATVPELARGNDVVRVDLDRGTVAARIALDADATVDGETAYARPQSIAIAGGVLVIGLARVAIDFDPTGPGAIATVDPHEDRRLDLEELPDLSGCGQLAAIPGDDARVMVLCGGDTFAGVADRRSESAILVARIDAEGAIAIERTWRAVDHPDAPSPTSGLVPLDATHALAVADPRGDDVVAGHDALVIVDLESGEATTALETDAPFTLGQGALGEGLVLVPDADARAIRRFSIAGARASELAPIPLPTCGTLPPRQIRRL